MRRTERDQAEGLRRLTTSAGCKVIAVSSGKGGVGKTHVAVNLAISLARAGRSTLLLDADLGLANVDVLLGLTPSANLAQVMRGELALEEVLIDGPSGLRIVPAASGVTQLTSLAARELGGLIDAFATLPMHVDVMVIDTATGIHQGVRSFCQAAHEVVVVVCDDPASITDAYALIKVLSRERGVGRFQILCNNVAGPQHGWALYQKLLAVTDRFLDVSLQHFGSVPEDVNLRLASRLQKAVVDGFPSSPSARAFKELARRADKWLVPGSSAGQPRFFLERMTGATSGRATLVMD